MAKKVRRVREPRLSKTQMRRPSARDAPKPAADKPAADRPEAEKPAVRLGAETTEQEFREEYYYVIQDLTRIGILAAAMLSGLVILAFIF
jgi:hypothetical protein